MRRPLPLLAALALTGCDELPHLDPPVANIGDGYYSNRVYRVDDVDAGVSCWVLLGAERGGISCVRLAAPAEVSR